MKKIIFITLITFNNAFALDKVSCKNLFEFNDYTLQCSYNGKTASKFAYQNFKKKNTPFEKFENNCTHFVSQSILAGFVGSSDINTVYKNTSYYKADKYEQYNWYFENMSSYGNSWSEAHSLYLYAKANNDLFYPYDFNGIMFDFIDRDYISELDEYGNRRENGGALHIDRIKEGDIIFVDHSFTPPQSYQSYYYSDYYSNTPLKNIKTDMKMDHSLIVTGISNFKRGYNKIRVTSNTSDYTDKGLGEINEKYNKKIEFHVFRPIYFIEK